MPLYPEALVLVIAICLCFRKHIISKKDVKIFWLSEPLTDRVIILIIATLVAQILHMLRKMNVSLDRQVIIWFLLKLKGLDQN